MEAGSVADFSRQERDSVRSENLTPKPERNEINPIGRTVHRESRRV